MHKTERTRLTRVAKWLCRTSRRFVIVDGATTFLWAYPQKTKSNGETIETLREWIETIRGAERNLYTMMPPKLVFGASSRILLRASGLYPSTGIAEPNCYSKSTLEMERTYISCCGPQTLKDAQIEVINSQLKMRN